MSGETVESIDTEKSVLIIDDERFSREYFQNVLEKIDCRVKAVPSGSEGLRAIKERDYELVILDIRLPDADGMDLLREIKANNHLTPVIMVTAYATVNNAVQAMKLGAFDFLVKPFDETEKVLNTVKNAMYQGKLERENIFLKNRLKNESSFLNIIGKSDSMRRVYELVKKTSEVDSNVLIQGESGTGKELIARAIHTNSARRKSVFLTIDCGAIPESLLETALFGHDKGAFTGAVKTKKGYFEEAQGGTLFLDEIGEASMSLQVRLLRVLQEKEVVHVGGTRPCSIDVRMLMATNKDLKDEVVKRRFRKDLFYRINVIKITLPPLRERKEDIPLLADHFIEKYCAIMNKKKKTLHPKALQILINHHWPGNVRELQHVIERIVALHTADAIADKDVMEHITMFQGDEEFEFMEYPYEQAKEFFEKKYLENLLKRFPKDLTKASDHAKVHPGTLYRKIKQYNIVK